jgi:hypothetical protein
VLQHSGHFPFFEENFLFTEWVRQFINGTADLQEDRDLIQQIAAPTVQTNSNQMRSDTRMGTAVVTGKNY